MSFSGGCGSNHECLPGTLWSGSQAEGDAADRWWGSSLHEASSPLVWSPQRGVWGPLRRGCQKLQEQQGRGLAFMTSASSGG